MCARSAALRTCAGLTCAVLQHDDDFDELEQATRPMDARRVQAQESYRKRREQMQQYPSVPVMMNPAKPATASHSFTQSKSE